MVVLGILFGISLLVNVVFIFKQGLYILEVYCRNNMQLCMKFYNILRLFTIWHACILLSHVLLAVERDTTGCTWVRFYTITNFFLQSYRTTNANIAVLSPCMLSPSRRQGYGNSRLVPARSPKSRSPLVWYPNCSVATTMSWQSLDVSAGNWISHRTNIRSFFVPRLLQSQARQPPGSPCQRNYNPVVGKFSF